MQTERGNKMQAVTNTKRTALHEAAESGHTEIVKLLLAAGADPHARDEVHFDHLWCSHDSCSKASELMRT